MKVIDKEVRPSHYKVSTGNAHHNDMQLADRVADRSTTFMIAPYNLFM